MLLKAKERIIRTAVDLDPQRSVYHYTNIFGKMRTGMRVMKELGRAIEPDSTNIESRTLRFDMLVHSYGKAPISKDNIVKSAEATMGVDSAMGHAATAKIHRYATDETDRAEVEYRKVVVETDRPSGAAQALEAFLKDTPEDVRIRFGLAITLIVSGLDIEKARTNLAACLSMRSDSGMLSKPMIHWVLGAAESLLGSAQESRNQWHIVERSDSEFDALLKASPDLKRIREILNA
jgi:hypothetical protein